MFSKPMKQNYVDTENRMLNYKEFYKNNVELKKYKLPELKSLVKKYKLRITGNKSDLINRIESYFNNMINAEKIQKRFRGWMVRYSFLLNGEAVKNRSLCVNDSDFVTLEPLDEIPRELFYSYKDSKDFYYGFNVNSLVQMMKTKGKINNPYNREAFDNKTLKNMISLYSIVQLIYPEHRDDTNKVNLIVCNNNITNHNILRTNMDISVLPQNITRRILERFQNNNDRISQFRDLYNEYRHSNNQAQTVINANPPTNRITNSIVNDTSNNVFNNNITELTLLSTRYYQPLLYNPSIINTDGVLRNNYNKIVEMRKKPMNTRIIELFMEIDQLGNYTQSTWFSNLSRRDYIFLYRHLYDIWSYRAQLTTEFKNKICPLFNPFAEIFTNPVNHNNILEDQIKIACLTIIENLVYSGIDQEHRTYGAMHALSGLTLVSRDARIAMPWLYESVAF